MKFYPGDWLKDSHLQMCSHKTKGIWIDLICHLWEAEKRGKLKGTINQFSRLVGISNKEMLIALHELSTTKTAKVNRRGSVYTLISRRIINEE